MPDAQPIRGLLLDMDGVFYVGNQLITGAKNTLAALRTANIPCRFITNTTTQTQTQLLTKLHDLGLEAREEEMFTAVSASVNYLHSLDQPSCYLLVRESVKESFAAFKQDDQHPDVVLIGDIGDAWDYATLNRVFNMLMAGASLVAMHRNKYWQAEDGLRMDIGAFVAALEYTTGVKATIIGKPSPAFFQLATASLLLPPQEVAIVGDDIESDIGGGQQIGLRTVLVKTGKYREAITQASTIKPDAIIDSIANLPEWLAP